MKSKTFTFYTPFREGEERVEELRKMEEQLLNAGATPLIKDRVEHEIEHIRADIWGLGRVKAVVTNYTDEQENPLHHTVELHYQPGHIPPEEKRTDEQMLTIYEAASVSSDSDIEDIARLRKKMGLD